jgi:carbon monoxide dehydrogenase subunit G
MSQLEFGGEERFAAPAERVFAVITDLDLLAANIPDAVSTERVDMRTLAATVRPGFSFLRGTMKMRIEMSDLEPPSRATMRIEGSGIGQAIRVESTSTVSPDGDGSLVRWQARVVERRGLVATISGALIQAAAGQVIRDAWQKVHQQVDG